MAVIASERVCNNGVNLTRVSVIKETVNVKPCIINDVKGSPIARQSDVASDVSHSHTPDT